MQEHISDAQFDALIRETLDQTERIAVETHLDACESCLERLASRGQRIVEELAIPEPLTEVDHPEFQFDVVAQIRRAVDSHEATPPGEEASVVTQLKLIQTVGRGGMGQVFEYRDTKFGRPVAIKILQDRWSADPRMAQRFRREMELTAAVDHPGCPAVYGNGTTPEGRDFFWMQLVTGPSLDQVMADFHAGGSARPRRSDAEFRGLLDIFRNICQTIAAAHERDIIHRDLKPQNVRVHRDGHPVVLDWGLAKRQSDHDVTDETPLDAAEMDLSQQGDRLGTLFYMAPEQARGDLAQANSQTDVYGLGAILHELLTGSPPHAALAAELSDRAKVFEVIGRAKPPALAGVPRELASICRKALATDQQDRYASARGLDKEIERWLAGDAVVEHRYGVAGHTALAIRRQPLAFAAAMATVLILVVAGLVTSRYSAVAATQRQLADERFGVALDAYTSLVVDVQDELGNEGRTQQARERLLGRAIDGITQLVARAENQPGAEFVAIRGRLRLAHLERDERGHLREAQEQYRAIVGDLRKLATARPMTAQHRKLLGDALKGFAICALDREGVAAAQPRFAELHDEALAFRDAFPGETSSAMMLSQSHVWLARLATREGPEGLPAAERHFEAARAILAALPKPDVDDAKFIYERLIAMTGLAGVNAKRGDLDAAILLQSQIIEETRQLVKRHPSKLYRTGLMQDQMTLGNYLKQRGDASAAITQLIQARQTAAALLADFPEDNALVRLNWDVTLNLATAYRVEGLPETAVELLTGLLKPADQYDVVTTELTHLYDQTLVNVALAQTREEMEHPVEAYAHYREALRIRSAILNRDPDDLENKREMLIAAQRLGSLAELADRLMETRALISDLCDRLDGGGQADVWPNSMRRSVASIYYYLGGMQLTVATTAAEPRAAAASALHAFQRAKALLGTLEGIPPEPLAELETLISACTDMLHATAPEQNETEAPAAEDSQTRS